MLITQILGEPENQVHEWRTVIQQAVGNNGQLVIDVVGHELEKLIGKQQPVPVLPPQEAKNRFEHVFELFVSAVMNSAHPIILVLDDLQWVDRESLRLIQIFLENSKYLLLVTVYRDNEVDESHPLSAMIEDVKTTVPTTTIDVLPLQEESVTQWLKDVLAGHENWDSKSCKELVDIIYRKTEGNAFFIATFLRALYEEELLKFDSGNNCWTWNLEGIKKHSVTDNVVDLMKERITQLSGEQKSLVEWAACLGNNFSVRNMEQVLKMPRESLMSALQSILDYGMGFIIDERFYFAHDRVQEAAYLLLSDQKKTEYHYIIGSRLLSLLETHNQSSSSLYARRLFDVVDHLNKGVSVLIADTPCITDAPEILALQEVDKSVQLLSLVEYNLLVAKNAEKAIAYCSALNYCQMGVYCFSHINEVEMWEKHHDLGYRLHKELAIIYETVAEFEKSEQTIQMLLEHTRTKLERAEVYGILIRQWNQRTRASESIELGRKVLKELDIDIPTDLEELKQLAESDGRMVENWITEHSRNSTDVLQTILELVPKESNPEDAIILQIVCDLIVSGFFADPLFFKVMVILAVKLSITRSFISASPLAFCFMGMLLISESKPKIGTEIGHLGLRLCREVFPYDLPQKTNVLHVYHALVLPFHRPIRELEAFSKEILFIGQECGSLQFPGYMTTALSMNLFFRGDNLQVQLKEDVLYENFVIRTKNIIAQDFFHLIRLINHTLDGTRNCFNKESLSEIE
jgi:predicted ATPase